jgi:uncharacterized protein (TIGR00297 family)
MPPKAIPPARDRLQSRLLVWIVTFAFCCLAYLARTYLIEQAHLTRAYLLKVLLISVAFAYAAWRLRAATPRAAILGGVTCLFITTFSSIPDNILPFHSGLTPLILVFVLTFVATRVGRARKAAAHLAEDHSGRNAAQVIANLGIAALIGSPLGLRVGGWFIDVGYASREGHILFVALFSVPTLAALAEAAADTVSSEIGQAFGGAPFMLTTLRRVPPGTDGAVSLKGTLAGIAAAAIIAATGAPALGMSFAECTVAFAAGVAGLFFDSLLGASVERKGWIGNDLVNFTSTAFAAAVALLAIRFGQGYLFR